MKFHKLELEAFGVFRDKQNVDFDALNEASLFLIRGNNGAGKTTILDALCFALYGEVPGLRGESKNKKLDGTQGASLKSDYAEDSVAPYVTLEFTVGETRYKVRRQPSWQKSGKATAENAKATLHRFSRGSWGDPIAGPHPGDVNMLLFGWKKTRSSKEKREPGILGLDIDQFSMIVMLPQGKFSEFLKASSEERSSLLQAIFPVKDYEQVMLALQTERARLGVDRDLKQSEIDAGFNRLLGAIGADSPADNLSRESWLRQTLDANNQELTDAEVMRQTADAQERESQQTLAQAEAAHKLARDISKHRSEKEAAESEIERLRERLRAIGLTDTDQTLAKHRLPLDAEVLDLGAQLTNIETYVNKSSEIAKQRVHAKEKSDQAAERSVWLEAQKDRVTSLNAIVQEEVSARGSLQAKETERKVLADLAEHLSEIEAARLNTTELKRQLPSYESNVQEALLALKALKAAEANSTSARLALELEAGAACTVCGSKTHPKLAQFDGHIPSGLEIESAEKKVSDANESLSAQKRDVQVSESNLKLLISQLSTNFSAKNEEAAAKNVAGQVEIEKTIESLNIKCEAIEKAKVDLTTLGAEIQLAQTLVQNLDQDIAELIGSIKQAERELKSLKVTDEDVKKRNDLTSKYDLATERLKVFDEVAEAWEGQKSKLSEATASLRALGGKPESAHLPDLEAVRESASVSREFARAVGQKVDRLGQNKKTLENYRKTLPTEKKTLDRISALFDEVDHLYKVSNGQVGMRVSLVNFYLGQRLKQIALLASERLMRMSDNHFYLEHSESSQQGNRKVGLELSLFDTWTMTRRPVSDFSGGELFMASLALALALSDVVKAESGSSVSLDTLFIDEGFGALDPTFTDTVVTVLEDLRTYGRVVGLVSHVAEIQERIPAQLVIEKTMAGSKVLPLKSL